MQYYKNCCEFTVTNGEVTSCKKISRKKFFGKKMIHKNQNSNVNYHTPTYGWGVDGSTLKPNPGISEYRCVDLSTKEIIFNTKIGIATNNIAEFLAIIQALIVSDGMGKIVNIFSDSQTAIAWTRKMNYNTNMIRNEDSEYLFEMMDEGIEWLKKNHKKMNSIVFWNTRLWGQIPADFGRAH